MSGNILTFIITYCIAFIILAFWIYLLLEKPFTLADVIFYPNSKFINHKHNIGEAKFLAVIKWVPFFGVIVCIILVALVLVYWLFSLIHWLYSKTIKQLFDKIVFK